MPKHGACNLGSINLSEFVKKPFTPDAYFDYQEFNKAVAIAVKALDIILDENMDNHPLPEQREMAYNYRNVGLGIMGMHDCLIKMCVVYGSEESKKIIDEIMHHMFRMAVITSNKLAESKGAFPKYNDSVLESEILKLHFADWELENFKEYGLRNCSLLSIAPSGSIGTMLNISTGCEPHFQLSYKRRTESLNGGKEQYYDVYVGVAQEYINKFNATELPAYFNTSSDIAWKDRVEMQGILQNHVDTAISSTVNLPNEATVEEIEKLYLYAWQQGLKGLTMFRDGCKRVGILTTEKPKNASNELTEAVESESEEVNKAKWPVPLGRGEVIKVNDNCIGKKRTLHTGCGTMHCTAFFDPVTGDLLETYLSKGSSGGCNSFMVGLSRMMSLAARGGISVENIVDQLKSTLPCTSYAIRSATNRDTSKGSSCPMAIGNVLMDMYKEMQDDIKFGRNDVNFGQNDINFNGETTLDITINKKPDSTTGPKCPRCGGILVFEGGCNNCKDCGWSKCD